MPRDLSGLTAPVPSRAAGLAGRLNVLRQQNPDESGSEPAKQEQEDVPAWQGQDLASAGATLGPTEKSQGSPTRSGEQQFPTTAPSQRPQQSRRRRSPGEQRALATVSDDVPVATGDQRDASGEGDADNGVRRTRGVIVHLMPEQMTFLRQSAAAKSITYGDVVLDALERFWDALDSQWAYRGRGYGLPPRGRRATGDPRVQVQLRLRTSALEILDQRVEETGAPSRNGLISRLLELDQAEQPR
jgi:hypothetical protein